VHFRVKLAVAVAVAGATAVAGTAAIAGGGARELGTMLTGYEETPQSISTTGVGAFRADVARSDNGFSYRLRYSGLEGNVLQAHVHFGQRATSGGISVFLCSNLGNGPAGTPVCPPPPATVTGTIDAADVIGPTGQGIAPGELNELLRAMRAGATYANVHSSLWPSGEIRGQVEALDDDD
jgi:hypothetical protein